MFKVLRENLAVLPALTRRGRCYLAKEQSKFMKTHQTNYIPKIAFFSHINLFKNKSCCCRKLS